MRQGPRQVLALRPLAGFGLCPNTMRAHAATESRALAVRAGRAWSLALVMAWASSCGGCQTPSRSCASLADCVEGKLCVEAQCRSVCNSQRDCTGHETCLDGVCLPAADAGRSDAATGADGATRLAHSLSRLSESVSAIPGVRAWKPASPLRS
ncbi:MAG: hypothetical protein ABIJ09_13235 [Pseudomonadota bacterium]